MMPPLKGSRSTRFAGVAILGLAVLSAGCGRPPDGAWLRFLGFSDATTATTNTTTTTTTTATTTVLSGELRDGTALTAYANFENRSLIISQTVGTGVLVYRVHIDYQMDRYSPPSVDYGCTLYLAPPADSKASTGSLKASVVPNSLKQWLIDTGAFESAINSPVVELSARVTFFGETDEGLRVETAGSVGIELSNAGATPR